MGANLYYGKYIIVYPGDIIKREDNSINPTAPYTLNIISSDMNNDNTNLVVVHL